MPLMAQDAPRQRLVPGGNVQRPAEPVSLEQNITIRLHGTTPNGSDIDLSLSGIGPRFTADQVIDDDTTLRCEFFVSQTETGYKVSYNVGAGIKVATQTSPDTKNFEYLTVGITNTVLCSADRPQVLSRNGAKSLQLTITKEVEPAAQ